MARKKNYKKRAPKKMRKRSAPKNRIILTSPRAIIPNYAMIVCRQKFCVSLLASGTQSDGFLYIKANSIYRPFFALGASAQVGAIAGYSNTDNPAGIGLWTGNAYMYNACRVYNSTLTVKTAGVLGSGTELLKMTIGVLTSSDTFSTYKTASGAMHSKEAKNLVGIYRPANLKNGVSTATNFGVSKSTVMTDDLYAGTITQDPTYSYQYVFAWQTATGNNIGANVPLEFELIQYCKLELPNNELTG